MLEAQQPTLEVYGGKAIHILQIREQLHALEKDVLASGPLLLEGDSGVRKLVSELRSVRDITQSIQGENCEAFKAKYSEMSLLLDYIIYLHISFFLICSEKFISKENEKKKPKIEIEVSQRMSYLTLMLTHLTNSLVSIRILVERGLDIQSKQIFRSYIEYSDISIAILGSTEFYNHYKQMGESEELDKKIWFKFIRPAALTKTLKNIYSNYADDKDIWDTVQNIRNPVYQRLSDYTHGHYMAVFTSSFTEGQGSTLLGRVNENIHNTMLNTIVYSYMFLKHSMVMIVQHQKIPFLQFGDEGLAYIKYYKLLELYFPTFIKRHAPSRPNL